jgi:glucosamine-6-phosphate deaminase
MRVIIVDTATEVAQTGGDIFLQQLARKPNSIFGLATGSSPLALYQHLISAHLDQGVSFAGVTTFNLDEYLGLASEHPQSYRFFMQSKLFNHIDIPNSSTHVPDGASKNPTETCRLYEDKIASSGGIDIQLLGIGRNGHIGFNEPSSSLTSRTRVKTLTQATVNDNARFFGGGETQPSLSLTMGIGTIMDSAQIVLIATGEGKADAVQATIEGAISASCPASILQMHRNAIVLVDRAAASKLANQEFYTFVEDQRRKLDAQ